MPSLRRTLALIVVGAVALGSPAAVSHAQTAPTRIIAINPFLPLLGSFQAEFEKKLQRNLSVAVSAAHTDIGDDDSNRYTTADLKLRLYPAERALYGFGIAAGVGFGRQSAVPYLDCIGVSAPCTNSRLTRSSATFLVEMQYQWLLGKQQNTAVSLGGGLKRFFVGDNVNDAFNEFVPTVRITIGYAFR